MRQVYTPTLVVVTAVVIVAASGVSAGWALAVGLALELIVVGILAWMQISKERRDA